MKNKWILWLILLLISIHIVQAQENTLTYTIVKDTTIVEHKINFENQQNLIEIKIPENSKEITLKYISDAFIEKTKDRYFTSNLGLIEGTKTVTVILPESASLKY